LRHERFGHGGGSRVRLADGLFRGGAGAPGEIAGADSEQGDEGAFLAVVDGSSGTGRPGRRGA